MTTTQCRSLEELAARLAMDALVSLRDMLVPLVSPSQLIMLIRCAQSYFPNSPPPPPSLKFRHNEEVEVASSEGLALLLESNRWWFEGHPVLHRIFPGKVSPIDEVKQQIFKVLQESPEQALRNINVEIREQVEKSIGLHHSEADQMHLMFWRILLFSKSRLTSFPMTTLKSSLSPADEK